MPQAIIDGLMTTARVHQGLYLATRPDRVKFRRKFHIEPRAGLCMDDRVDVPCQYFGLPYGVVQPMRNLGANFSMEWHPVANAIDEWVNYSERVGFMPIYYGMCHDSDHKEHGCAGHNNDTEAAISSQFRFVQELREVYGDRVLAFVLKTNTDTDAVTLYTERGNKIDMGMVRQEIDELAFVDWVRNEFPSIDDVRVHMFLAHTLKGNQDRVRELRLNPRTEVEKTHQPDVLAFGWGLQWCRFRHDDSRAGRVIKVAPWGIHNSEPVVRACGLIQKHTKSKEGLLLVSQGYRRGMKEFARKQVHGLARYVQGIIGREFPNWDFLHPDKPILTVTDLDNMEVSRVE